MASDEFELPDEVLQSLREFEQSLDNVEDILKPMLEIPLQDLREKLDPLQCAKADLVTAYIVNSLFWVYMVTRGLNPKEHPITEELERIRKYMAKVKQAADEKSAMKLDKGAAQRFVKSALWTPDTGEGSSSLKERKRKGSSKYKLDNRKKKTKQD